MTMPQTLTIRSDPDFTEPPDARGEPVWELAERCFPRQGSWTAESYLKLELNHLVELVHGQLEFVSKPTWLHQAVVLFLYRQLEAFVAIYPLGRVSVAPLPIRLGANLYREADIVFLRPERLPPGSSYPVGADLVMEVVSDSPQDRERDLVTKRLEYALAGISEYWIVDPLTQTITVLTLPTGATAYTEHGCFGAEQLATSVLLQGLQVPVTDCMAAGQPQEMSTEAQG